MNSSTELSPQLMAILAGYIPIGLMALTIVCNCFTIYIYAQDVFSKVSETFYLKAMALFDSLLIFQTLGFSLSYAFGIDLKTSSNLACKLLYFASYSFESISTWCEALASLDRCIHISIGGKFKILNRVWFKFTLIGAIFVVNSALYYPMFAYFVLIDMSNQSQNETTIITCLSTNGYYSFVLSWIDLFAKIIVPFSIMFVSTLFLVKSLVSSRKRARVKEWQNITLKSNNSASTALKKSKSREQRDFQFALTSITLNILSLLLNLPITFFTIYDINVESGNDLLFAISNICFYLNLSYKFFLYVWVNVKFREEFLKIFKNF